LRSAAPPAERWALLAWHNLLRGAAAGAAETLEAFWRDNSATAPHEQAINNWLLWASILQNFVAVRAEEFLAALAFEDAWRSRDPDAVMGFFADDATLVSWAPFPAGGRHTGRTQIRPFVTEHLAREVRVDLTRKQVAHNGVARTVRAPAGDEPANRAEGVAEAVFRGKEVE
jgi:uncharacterized protein (TIGR02246 family)